MALIAVLCWNAHSDVAIGWFSTREELQPTLSERAPRLLVGTVTRAFRP